MNPLTALSRHIHVYGLFLGLLASAWAQAEPRQVKVGVYPNEPKIMLGDNELPSGILGELLEEIARREGWTLTPVPCEWQECLELLKAEQIDLLPDVAFSEARAQWLDFHRKPSLYSWSVLYSREKMQFDAPQDFKEMRIAVMDGSIQQSYFNDLLESANLQGQLVPVASLTQGFEQAADGQVDAAVANKQFGDRFAKDYDLLSRPLMLPPVRMFYATTKGRNPELLSAIDRHLETWLEDPGSIYYQIQRRWSGEALPFSIPAYLWWGLAALAGLLLLALAGGQLLRRQIAEKTRHLRASEDRLNTILDSVEAYIYIKDPQLRYQYANAKVCALFGKPMEQVIGQTDAQFFDSATTTLIQSNDRRVILLGERVQSEEVTHNLVDNDEYTYLTVKLPLRDAQGQIYGLCGISTDISEHRKDQERINQLAFYDPLTGLPNRRLLQDRLHQALAKHARGQQQGALLFIDLDNFKDLNDTQGHDMGDQLLQQVAKRLSDHVRAQDTLARLGGDEFVLMLEGLSTKPNYAIRQVETVASKVIAALAVPYDLQGHQHVSTASIGIALFPETQASVEEMLKRADLAMYQAKAAGRNGMRFFDPLMQAEASARASLESDMRHSLREGHFVLHYQPQVNERRQLVSAEALIRWQHPSRGLIGPGGFIPLAESTGLILPMGRWLLHSACAQLVSWASDPQLSKLILAINISARQFHHPDFVADVLAALEESGADPTRLELELTESQLVEDVDQLIDKMNTLKDRGIRLSLDDFGTGYSSLSYLKRLPLDQLKIDQSFVGDLLDKPRDAAIVRTILALGHNLDLEVTAEGVETQAQFDGLLLMGCRKFQGYLFARPGPAQLLQNWNQSASPQARASSTRLLN